MERFLYEMTVHETPWSLGTDMQQGLGETGAKKRLREFGPNQLEAAKNQWQGNNFAGIFTARQNHDYSFLRPHQTILWMGFP